MSNLLTFKCGDCGTEFHLAEDEFDPRDLQRLKQEPDNEDNYRHCPFGDGKKAKLKEAQQ